MLQLRYGNTGQKNGNLYFSQIKVELVYSDDHRHPAWSRRGIPRSCRRVQEFYPFQGVTIMVWGGIFYNGPTELCIYRDTMTVRYT